MKHSLPILAVAVVFACAPASDNASVSQAGSMNDAAAVQASIDSALANFGTALVKGDTAALHAPYTDDAVMLPANAKAVRGRAERSQFNAGMLQAFSVTAAGFRTTDLIVSGDYAIETGVYTMTMKPKPRGAAISDTGKYISIWKKQTDGSWKMIRDAFNSDLAAH